MGVDIYEWTYAIPLGSLGLQLKDRAGRNALAASIAHVLSQQPSLSNVPTPARLQTYIDLYREQVTADAAADINKFLTYRAGLGLTFGGLSTDLSPLAILPKDVRPNSTAISVIGEGLTGWFLQNRRGWRVLSRPIGEGPDFLFEDGSATPSRTILVEVKSTQQSNVTQQVRDATIPSLEYTMKVAVSGGHYICFIAGVVIKSSSDFELLNLEIALT